MSPSAFAASAQTTAFNIASLASHPGMGHLVAREAGELAARFLADRPRFRFWLGMARRPRFRPWFDFCQALKAPGEALHQTLRSLSLEEAAIHGLEAGMEQVVMLGGGFDTLAARLARRYPRAFFLELDPPSVLAAKREVLERSGFLPPNLSLLPMDPERPNPKAILATLPGFRNDAPCLVLCQNLLLQSPKAAVERIFSDLAALPCPVLRFAFAFSEPEAMGEFEESGNSRLASAWRRWRGRAPGWSLPARELGGFLARRGFALEELADAEVLRARFLQGMPRVALAEGEKIAIASVSAR